MTDIVYVADIKFEIISECRFCWTDTDRCFFLPCTEFERTVTVEVKHVWDFCTKGIAAYTFDSSVAVLQGVYEPREYYAVFQPGFPPYMRSYRDKDRIRLEYLASAGVWNHPNFRIWNHLYLEELMLEQDALLLHACYTVLDGKGILFSGPSGAGKTTQANIWKDVYGNRVINGDLSLLHRRHGQWYVCGFPYHGSAKECLNETWPLAAIVVVRQGTEVCFESISDAEKAAILYSELTVNRYDSSDVMKAFDLLEDLTSKVQIIKQYGTLMPESAILSYSRLFRE